MSRSFRFKKANGSYFCDIFKTFHSHLFLLAKQWKFYLVSIAWIPATFHIEIFKKNNTWQNICIRHLHLNVKWNVSFVICVFFSFFFLPCLVYKTPGVTTGRGQNIFNCKYNSPPPSGKVCDVNVKDFKKCTQENNYSYHKSSPCVFIKMNRIYGWMPTFYNRTDNLPDRMPKQLKHRIVNETDPTEVNKNL